METFFNMSCFKRLFPGLLPLFVISHFTHHLLTAIPVPLSPMIRSEFALDYAQSGWVISAFSLAYGFGQLPAGWLSDRIGPRILITVGISGMAVAGLLVGFSKFYLMILCFLVMMGLMGGCYHPAAPTAISAFVEQKKRGQALGLHNIGGGASYFISPILATAIASKWSWRGAFISLAIPTMILGTIPFVLLGRESSKTQLARPADTTDSGVSPHVGRTLHLASFLILSMVAGALFVSIISFIPLYAVDNLHVSKKTVGVMLGVIYAAGLWVGPLAGNLSDRFGRVPLLLAVSFAGGPVCYMLTVTSYGWGFFALLVMIGIMLYTRMTVTESYVIGQTTERNRSTIFGIYYFASTESSALLTPALGYSIDRLGFSHTFTIAGTVVFLLTLIFSIPLWGSPDN